MTKNERLEALEQRVAALEAMKWLPPPNMPTTYRESWVPCSMCGRLGAHTCVVYTTTANTADNSYKCIDCGNAFVGIHKCAGVAS